MKLEEIRKKLYRRASGRCECEMSSCDHPRSFWELGGRCTHSLTHGLEAHHRWRNGPDNLGNLTAMCATCHRNTRTYGRG